MNNIVFKIQIDPRNQSLDRRDRSRQWGAATLVTAVVLLTAVTGLTLYSAAVSTTQLKISRNDAHAKKSFEYAQAGITEGVAWLNAQQEWITSGDPNSGWIGMNLWQPCGKDLVGLPCGNGHKNIHDASTFTYTMKNVATGLVTEKNYGTQQVYFLSATTLIEEPLEPIIQVISSSIIAEQQEPTVIRQSVKRYSTLANSPPSVLLIEGDLNMQSPMKISLGDTASSQAPNWRRWILGTINTNRGVMLCRNTTESTSTDGNLACSPENKSSVAASNNVVSSALTIASLKQLSFPGDLFSFLFLMSEEHAPLLAREANQIQNCDALSEQIDGGFYWYDNDQPCVLPAMGSPQRPALFVSRSHTLIFAEDSPFYGVIVLLPNVNETTVNMESRGEIHITGSLVSLTSLNVNSAGAFSIDYDQELILTLRHQIGGFAKIPGTWNDAYELTAEESSLQ